MSYASGRCRPSVSAIGRFSPWAVIVILSAMMSACGGGPPPKLYLLESVAETQAQNAISDISIGALGITQITLPGYASDVRIASRAGDGVIVQLDRQRWAEDPEDAIGRLFAQRLRLHSNSPVLIEPWPRDFGPVARIELIFDQLLRQSDGGAQLSGYIRVLSGDGRRLVQSLPFAESVVGRSQDGVEFFNAVSDVVDGLAMDTVELLIAGESAS